MRGAIIVGCMLPDARRPERRRRATHAAPPCRAAASPAVLVATVGQGVFRGLQDMRTPLGITLAANTINLALDTVLILGLGWGVTGAACATSAAEWAAGAAYLALLWQRRGALGGLDVRSVLGAGTRQTVAEFGPFLRAGGAVLMRTAVLLGTKTLATATAARWVARRGGAGGGRRPAALVHSARVALVGGVWLSRATRPHCARYPAQAPTQPPACL